MGIERGPWKNEVKMRRCRWDVYEADVQGLVSLGFGFLLLDCLAGFIFGVPEMGLFSISFSLFLCLDLKET